VVDGEEGAFVISFVGGFVTNELVGALVDMIGAFVLGDLDGRRVSNMVGESSDDVGAFDESGMPTKV